MKPVAVIIVGADALLAAHPATPIQLWHACVAAGYDIAVPATWGDELIAAECLRMLGAHHEPVAVMCTCPKVARAVADLPFDLSPNLVATVAPPVAAAKYVRRVYGDRRVHITYAGSCPAAADSAIDAWITPEELLQRFRETEIVVDEQPELFESILPPDRRRHLSQPGGLPTADQVAKLARPRRVQEVDDADIAEAFERHLSSAVRTLVDFAPRAGCSCSGASMGVSAADARTDVTKLEPPRSSRPVMADPGGLGLSRRLPVRQAAPGSEPAVRPQLAFAAPPTPRAERDRPVVATRAATLSPLSWHLRDRAHPQPSTTARPEHRPPPARPDQRPTPESTRAVGASSSAWVAASTARTERAEPTPDPVTAAAVRALEQAAALRPLSREVERVSDDAPAREPETIAGATSPTEPRQPRTTPPGGYWFAAPVAAPASDSEVSRPSAPVDAVPDDVGTPAVEAERVEDHPESEMRAEAIVEEVPLPEAVVAAAVVDETALDETALEETALETAATSQKESQPSSRDDDAGAQPPATSADARLDSADPEATSAGDDDDHPVPPPAPAPAQRTSASGPLPWKWLVGAAVLVVAAVAVSRQINARVTTEESGMSALTSGNSASRGLIDLDPLPAVQAESSAARPAESVPTGGAAPPSGSGNRPRRQSSRIARSAPPGDPPSSLSQATGVDVPARDTSAASTVARDSARRDAVRRDSARRDSLRRVGVAGDTAMPIVPPVERRDSAASPALTAREIEIQAIRAELARRIARLDSMERAAGSLYVNPRRPPPGVPPGPTAPPPGDHNQRD